MEKHVGLSGSVGVGWVLTVLLTQIRLYHACKLIDTVQSVRIVNPAKMAEPIKMSFGMWTWVGPRNHVLDVSPDPHAKRQL